MLHYKYTMKFYCPDVDFYREAVGGFIETMDRLAKQVEREKCDAIIVSNKLASLPHKTEEEMTMLQVSQNVKVNFLGILHYL